MAPLIVACEEARDWDTKGDVRVRNSQGCRTTAALEM